MQNPKNKDLSTLGGDQSPLFEDDLVAFFFEYAVKVNGAQPPKTIRSRMVVKIKEAIKDRADRDLIRATIKRMVDDALTPASFEEVMWKMQHEIATGDTQEVRDLVRRFMEANGNEWPTGTRWAAGTHSGRYVQDVLGFDRPDRYHEKMKWGRPSREDVVACLKALDAAGVDITRRGISDRDVPA